METTKDNDVSDDNIFLQLLLEKHNISARQLKGWTGIAESTIYKYLSGERTIPSIIWRSIFAHTHDIAVFNLIAGDVPCIIATISKQPFVLNSDALRQLLMMRQKQLYLEQLILDILEDGRVDSSDTKAVANYRLAFPDMVTAQAQIYQAILNAYSKTETANAKP